MRRPLPAVARRCSQWRAKHERAPSQPRARTMRRARFEEERLVHEHVERSAASCGDRMQQRRRVIQAGAPPHGDSRHLRLLRRSQASGELVGQWERAEELLKQHDLQANAAQRGRDGRLSAVHEKKVPRRSVPVRAAEL